MYSLCQQTGKLLLIVTKNNIIHEWIYKKWVCTTNQPHPKTKTPRPQSPYSSSQTPTPKPCEIKSLIYGQIMLVNKWYHSYLHVKSGVVCLKKNWYPLWVIMFTLLSFKAYHAYLIYLRHIWCEMKDIYISQILNRL